MRLAKFCAIGVLSLGLMLPAAQGQMFLAESHNDNWSFGRTTTLPGNQQTQTVSDTASTTLTLPYYDGVAPLARVVITYTAPLPGAEAGVDTITAALSLDSSGTNNFDFASIQANTTIGSSNLFNGLLGIDATEALKFNTAAFSANASDSDSNFSLTNPDTKNFSVTRNYSSVIMDTTDQDILDFFTQSGNYTFQLTSIATMSYERDESSPNITFSFTGVDQGRITVAYYAIPEPASMLLLALGSVLMLGRGRRTA